MLTNRYGLHIVEFALVFPLFMVLGLVSLDLTLLSLQQISWTQSVAMSARKLAIGSLASSEEMEEKVQNWLNPEGRNNVHVHVHLTSLPTKPQHHPWRQKKSVQLIQLTTQKNYRSPFPLLKIFPIQLHAKRTDVRILPRRIRL